MSEHDARDAEVEEVHGELVPAGAPVPVRAERAAGVVVVRQAAAVAATSFAAGMVTVAAVRAGRARRARRHRHRALPVLATRSFLVDVHLLGTRD
jgi:hypothetical protein